jgi:hypothetical protein
MVMSFSIPHIFSRDFPHMEKIEFFRRVLYFFLLFNALTLLPAAHDLFAYYGLVGTKGWNTAIPTYRQGTYGVINVLSHPANSVYWWLYIVFIVGQIFFLITGLLKKWPLLSSLMVFFFTINLFMKGYLAFTGGEVLMNFILFYLIFIQAPKSKGAFGDLQNIVNNSFYWILLIQICLLYFFSSIYKLYDQDWISGNAIMYISRLNEFDSPLTSFFKDSYIMSAIGGYITLAYQLLFFILVWIKKIKIPFLIVGVILHLLISFGMGVFTFGITMVLTYLLFLDEKHLLWIKSKLKRKARG